jgi:hypothetical protein
MGIDPEILNRAIDYTHLSKLADRIPASRQDNVELLQEMRGMRKDLKKIKQLNVSFDKKGMTVALQQQNSITEILNNQFNA